MRNKSDKVNGENSKFESQPEPIKEDKNMENNISGNDAKENQRHSPINYENRKILKIVVTVLLILAPVVIIIYRNFVIKDIVPNNTNNEIKPVITDGNDPNLGRITSLENAVRLNPDYKNLIDLSLAYMKEKKPEKSIEPLKKAIKMQPKNAAAFNNLGTAYNMMHRYKDGILNCTKAVQLDSDFQLAKNNLNWVKGEEKKTLLSIKTLEETPENKRKPDYFIELGMDYLRLQDYDKCIELLNKSINANLKKAEATNDIGYAYLTQFKYKEAINYFKKAVEIDPNFQLAKNNLAYAIDEQDKYIQSLKSNQDN